MTEEHLRWVKEPPEGTRLVLMAEDLATFFGTRTDGGYRLSFDWGEERPEGWYEPSVTVHYDDNPLRDMTNAFAAFLFALGYPYDMQCFDDDGHPIVPPVDVLERLIDLWDEFDGHQEVRDAYRWTFADEIGVDPWA